MKFIMYHYVRPYDSGMPHFRGLRDDDFARQLDYFAAEFGFVSPADFSALLAGELSEHPGVVLTFDDGVIDHYQYVFPELQRRGLWGIFYVPTGHYQSQQLLDVHRIHCLLGKLGGSRLLELVRAQIRPEDIAFGKVEEFQKLTYARQDNDAATTEFKRIFNYLLSAEARDRLLTGLMSEFFAEAALQGEFYVQPAQLSEMQSAGMVIGGHSVNHPVLSKLPREQQATEIGGCFAWLDAHVGPAQPRTFCYPYGGFHSFNQTTVELLQEAGCPYALNVEQRDATAEDFARQRYALPRYDCNQFPHGQVRR
jgi:peptidoglycan/xylan/chitin deacetylase (PgdA/CDA1 family)